MYHLNTEYSLFGTIAGDTGDEFWFDQRDPTQRMRKFDKMHMKCQEPYFPSMLHF